MKMLRTAREGIQSLAANPLRTFFMMAGTIVGIAALTVIMAIGKGTESQVMKRVENFGPRAMMLVAGGGRTIGPPDGSVTTLTLDDVRALREEVPGLEIVTPQAWQMGAGLRYGSNQIKATMWGVEPEWHEAWDWYTVEGEEITDEDVATMARVCVIGSSVKRDLFGDADPIGESLYINKVAVEVKGVLDRRGIMGASGGDFDNRILLPITTAMRRVMNVDHIGGVRMITQDAALMPEQIEQIVQLMRARHRITPPLEDDFRINTPLAIAEMVRGTSGTLTMLLTALAGLSLLVGGVVLMNILLISVGERTAEIGLRRAVGATRRDIFTQFLTESLSVTFLGMILGSALGWGVSLAIRQFTPLPAVISWEPLALAVGFALLIGTFFGVQPARRAARLHPVEALR
jgi:putative ABC transport system permease protein